MRSAILLDIEGTTTPIAFVTQVLFPYARQHVRRHLEQHAASAELEPLLARLRDEHAAVSRAGEPSLPDRLGAGPLLPPWADESISARLASAASFVEWLMDRDRKSTALKELQGQIWEQGYRRGELMGEVFPDVPPALERWHAQQRPVGIFSSGSVLAQQLLFRHSSAGDLTRWLRWYFDTRVGAKADPHSYHRIAQTMGFSAGAIVFVSDVTRELDAAREAGLHVCLSVRPGNAPVPDPVRYPSVRSFDALLARD